MGLRIAKIYEETIPKELGDVPIKVCDNLSTGMLIRTYHVPVLFGVELAGEARGVHEVTEHHRELSTFSFGYTRGS